MISELISGNPEAPIAPVWLRAVMTREGDEVVTRCCVVTQGQFLPVEVRVNVPELVATLTRLGMLRHEHDKVGLFGFVKKAVKAVTKNKVVKAVTKTVSKAIKSPVVHVAAGVLAPGIAPGLLLGAHNTSVATGGKGILKGPMAKVVNAVTKATLSTALPGIGPAALKASQTLGTAVRQGKPITKALPAVGAGALGFVLPQASAALGLAMKTVTAAKAQGAIAATARAAQAQVKTAKQVAAAINTGKVAAARLPAAKQVVARAVNLQKNLKKTAPALAKKAVTSAKVKKAVSTIAQKAKAGDPKAKASAAIIAKGAKVLDEVARLNQQFSGGVPGLLVTSDGRIVKAPKGRFTVRSTTARADALYRGPSEAVMRGQFSAVAGSAAVGASPGWGGARDPGNDLDGPLSAITVPNAAPIESWRAEVAGRWTP